MNANNLLGITSLVNRSQKPPYAKVFSREFLSHSEWNYKLFY